MGDPLEIAERLRAKVLHPALDTATRRKGRTAPSAAVSHCKVLPNLPAQKVAKITAIHS
jgi:hypothetical protein